jgi:hypothetical protein
MSTNKDQTSNNIIQITNVIFSHSFIDGLLALNDNKMWVDHETGGILPGNELKKQKNEIAKQTQLIQLAQHLGKNDFLEKYFANLASSGD